MKNTVFAGSGGADCIIRFQRRTLCFMSFVSIDELGRKLLILHYFLCSFAS